MRLDIDLVANADENQAEEEARQHHDGPESSSTSLHEEDSGNGTNQQGTTTNQGHVIGLFCFVSDLVHQHGHVVHDGVDTRELTEENHDICVDDCTSGARDAAESSVLASTRGRMQKGVRT